jgi:cell division ATPase FtsA
VLAAGAKQALKAEREVVHSLPVGFSLDGERGVRDPRGMIGDTLGVDMHVLTGDARRCAISNSASTARIFRSSGWSRRPMPAGWRRWSTTSSKWAAACIDMGGGTTTISVFAEGKFVHADSIPLGGNTSRWTSPSGLSTRLEDAERLKVMHGSALPNSRRRPRHRHGSADRRRRSTADPGAARGDDPHHPRPRRGDAGNAARPADPSGYANAVGKRVVLTGGASQLTGLPELRGASSAAMSASAAARRGRPAGSGEGPGLLDGGRPADLSAGGGTREPAEGNGRSVARMPRARAADSSAWSVVERTVFRIRGQPHNGRNGERRLGEEGQDNDDQSEEAGHHRAEARITVFGVGGGGGNAVNNMITAGLARASSSSSPTPTRRR